MRRNKRLTSSLVGLGSGLLLVGCAPESSERLGQTQEALSQGHTFEVEPNDTTATATPIGNDTVVRAKIFQTAADTDYFAFQGTAGDRVYAATITSFSPVYTDTTLALFQPDGTTLIEADADDGSLAGNSSSIAGATLTQTGTHYIRVVSASPGTSTNIVGPYDLHFKVQSGSPVAETEPNDMLPQALPASGWVSGALSLATDIDAFTLNLNAGDTIFASLDLDPLRDNTPWNGQLTIAPFGPTNTGLLVNDASTAAANSEAFPITVKNAGLYGIGVTAPIGAAAVGDYHLSVAIHPATPATANCTTYTSTDVPQTIPTGPGQVTSTIVIPGNPRIADLDISLNLNHTAPTDLDIILTSPAGNMNGIVTDVGGGAGTTFNAWDVTFDDEAAIPPSFQILNGLILQPESAYRLDWFDGENAGGTWTLALLDDTANNGGTLNGWSITICEPPAAPTCAGGAPMQSAFSTDFESGAAGFTHSGTQDEWELGTPITMSAPILSCNSGTNCWKTDLDNTYNASSNQDLVSPPIDLTNRGAPAQLRWAMKYQLERAAYDHAWVAVREVGGANLKRVWEHTGPTMNTSGATTTTIQESAGWGEFTADVSAYAGKQIELVFHVDSDTSVQLSGLAIDDVSVVACTPCGNAVTDPGEACDDGNMTNGDGCDVNCTVSACGNGIAAGTEACDDGNMVEGDGCDTNCTVSACGNGISAGTEACDDGNMTEGDGCDTNCTVSACGNGIIAGTEICDDNNTVDGDGCDSNCTVTACGNGIATMGEDCDDGNVVEGDGCDSNCTISACGNGIIAGTEICDDNNLVDGDGCDSNCTITACGNGIATMGEACDDGNITEGDGCDTNCTISACGNGIIAGTEVCDDNNLVDGDGCDSNCTITACGNGVITMGEVCDDANMVDGDGCDTNCTVTGCGNGIATMGEACDDGNMAEGDGCDTNCTISACGNGIIGGLETCDDNNTVDGDGCDSNCTVTGCNNGVVTMGEACDDGNMTSGDGCDVNCTVSACGNGVAAGSEGCDDGNQTDGDGCDNNCTVTGCGNGVLTANEVCDDGNVENGDGCDNNCTVSACGNGVTAGMETCDDGNTTDGDGCDNNCTATGCGNGVVTDPEECDDGNLVSGDGCADDCTTEGVGGMGGGGAGGASSSSSSSSSSSGMGGAGGGEGGSGGASADPLISGGGCDCTTVATTETKQSPFYAIFGLFGLLAAKLRRRK